MKSLTPKEKELLKQKIREYHANKAIEIAKELEKDPRGNVVQGWVEIIRSLLELLRNRRR